MHHPRFRGTMREMMILVCLFILFKIMHVTAQNDGFISIDCGLPPNQIYVDQATNITYVSDVGFIDTGVNRNIKAGAEHKRLLTVRSFPDRTRNCYTINVNVGSKYLVRATFLYGNYDGLNTKHSIFELHLGVNLWKTMNISNPGEMYETEVITVATTDFLLVCLVNIGSGTPFISGLDIRKLHNAMYPVVNASTSLRLLSRYNFGGPAHKIYRYPDDPYDRIWSPYNITAAWAGISTTSKVENDVQGPFDVPMAVMSTAATPVNSKMMEFYLDFTPCDAPENSFIIFHFSELSSLSTTDSRVFDIYLDGTAVRNGYSPPYLKSSSVYTSKPLDPSPKYHWALNATADSTLPPVLNALEVYTQIDLLQLPTDSGDVDAITAIMVEYHMKGNWIGDPCAPMKYSWDGLNCSYTPDPQRIISINLSSRALTGIISSSFANLTALRYLDLSNNNLTGIIPDALRNLPSLEFLDLSGNNLIGKTPPSVLTRSEYELLEVSLAWEPSPSGPTGDANDTYPFTSSPSGELSPSGPTGDAPETYPVTSSSPPDSNLVTPSPPENSSSGGHKSIFMPIGLGVGVPLVLVLIGLGVFCKYRKTPNDINPGTVTDAKPTGAAAPLHQETSCLTINCLKTSVL